MPVEPERIGDILDEGEIERIRGSFDPKEMAEIFSTTLPKMYEESEPYVRAILEIFSKMLPEDVPVKPAGRKVLTFPDRERILIALLASRGAGYPLAVHVYLGLICGITPDEMGSILLVAGVYCGIDSFTTGIYDAMKTLRVLGDRLGADQRLNPRAVNDALREAFGA